MFNSLEKAFSHCVIPAIPLSAHTLGYLFIEREDIGNFTGGILNATIRVKDKVIFYFSISAYIDLGWDDSVLGCHIFT